MCGLGTFGFRHRCTDGIDRGAPRTVNCFVRAKKPRRTPRPEDPRWGYKPDSAGLSRCGYLQRRRTPTFFFWRCAARAHVARNGRHSTHRGLMLADRLHEGCFRGMAQLYSRSHTVDRSCPGEIPSLSVFISVQGAPVGMCCIRFACVHACC